MERIKVTYFVERNRSGDITATGELSVELPVPTYIIRKLKHAKFDPENSKPLLLLSEALEPIAKLQGYKFVSIKTIEDVGTYGYD
jgi:hypothetical protein